MKNYQNWVAIAGLMLMSACQGQSVDSPKAPDSGEIQKYWSGAAEISRYALSQARYGENNEGDAVLIYVREPFLAEKQVKDESGGAGVPTLKLNSTRKFLTGVYPYSTMVSTFQPMDRGALGSAFKVTTSVQEWCGHVFSQTNRKGGDLRTVVSSYFEQEDGQVFRADAQAFLEDEVWTAIRLAPQSLPSGNFEMIPGSLFSRFAHLPPTPSRAMGEWVEGLQKGNLRYRITYPELNRFLEIEISEKAPFTVESWREGRGTEVTEAKLTHRLTNQEYWGQKGNRNRSLREKLGLNPKQ